MLWNSNNHLDAAAILGARHGVLEIQGGRPLSPVYTNKTQSLQ